MNKITILGIGGQEVVTMGKLITTSLLYEGFSPVLVVTKGSMQTGGPVRCDIQLSLLHDVYDAVLPNNATRDWLILEGSMRELISSKGSVWINSDSKQYRDEYNIDALRLKKESGSRQGENLILLGFYLAFNQAISMAAVEEAMVSHLPNKDIRENLYLLRIGHQVGLNYLG